MVKIAALRSVFVTKKSPKCFFGRGSVRTPLGELLQTWKRNAPPMPPIVLDDFGVSEFSASLVSRHAARYSFIVLFIIIIIIIFLLLVPYGEKMNIIRPIL